MYEDLSLYIDGRFINGGGRHEQDVLNPANNEVIGKLPHATREDLDLALASARRAFDAARTKQGIGSPRLGIRYQNRSARAPPARSRSRGLHRQCREPGSQDPVGRRQIGTTGDFFAPTVVTDLRMTAS